MLIMQGHKFCGPHGFVRRMIGMLSYDCISYYATK
jgi:hypothetical protein